MLRIALLLCFLFYAPFLFAQSSVTINGTVKDTKGKPLQSVNIGVKDSYDGSTSNVNGEFSFITDAKDSIIIMASSLGYSKYEKSHVVQGKELRIDIVLKERISDIKAVVITAGAFEASDEKKGTTLKPLDIVTTAGSNGDNFGALKTLPGTQLANDREGLFVRGGTGAETQTFIDGTWVRNAFTAGIPDLGARGRFNPFIFKGTVFSTGGYSALYGGALSSAVILETVDLPDRSNGFFNLSSVGIGAGIQKLAKDKKSSWGAQYNYTNLTPYFWIIKQNIRFEQAPRAHQLDLNYRTKVGKQGLLKFYGYVNNTYTSIQRENVTSKDYNDPNKIYFDEYSVKNTNLYGNLSYRVFLKKDWKLNAGLSVSQNYDIIDISIRDNNNEIINDTNFLYQEEIDIRNKNFIATSKIVLQKNFAGLNTIRFGAEHVYTDDRVDAIPVKLKPFQRDVNPLTDQYSAIFAEGDIYITNALAGKIGIRGEYSALLNRFNIAPRVSAAYKLSKRGQVSFAYGMFYQKPELQFLLNNSKLNYMRADHYILNYQYQPKDRLLRLEAFYKNYIGLIKTSPTTNNGTGYARGLELFYRDKKTLPGIDFWVSYSFIDTKRDFLNYIRQVQPDFVATHTGSLVFKKFWTKFMFGINGTYTYASGRPYINPNLNFYANSELFMKERTIDYHTINLSLNYLKTIKKVFTVFVLGVNNPIGFKQEFGYNFAQRDLNGDGIRYGQPILPTARQFVFVGMFMSWGVDRTQEAIDNNL